MRQAGQEALRLARVAQGPKAQGHRSAQGALAELVVRKMADVVEDEAQPRDQRSEFGIADKSPDHRSRRLGGLLEHDDSADKAGATPDTRARVKKLVASEGPGGFVAKILGRELGL